MLSENTAGLRHPPGIHTGYPKADYQPSTYQNDSHQINQSYALSHIQQASAGNMTRVRNILGSDTASVLQELADSQISKLKDSNA